MEDDLVLLDTNVAIYLVKEHRLFDLYREDLRGKGYALGFVNAAELLLTARRAQDSAKTLKYWEEHLSDYRILLPDQPVQEVWSQIKAHCLDRGRPRGDNDLWTAALAIRWELPLVSHNRKHFEGIPGLTLITHG
jgi:tRNA(fMet)-specific endonuclease VapC